MITKYLLWNLPTVMIAIVSMFIVFPMRKHSIKKKGMSTTSFHEFGIFLFMVYMAILLSLTVNLDQIWVSLYYGWPLSKISFFSGQLNFKIFNGISTLRDLWMLLGNVFLFLPFGFFIPLLWDQPKWWWSCVFGALLSFSIESIQLILIGRSFDVNDILMNSVGTLCGWLVWRMIVIMFTPYSQRFRCIRV